MHDIYQKETPFAAVLGLNMTFKKLCKISWNLPDMMAGYGDIRIGAIGNILKVCLHNHWEKPEILPKNL